MIKGSLSTKYQIFLCICIVTSIPSCVLGASHDAEKKPAMVKEEEASTLHPSYSQTEDSEPFEDTFVGDQSAGDSRAFFSPGSARSVFDDEAKITQQPKVHVLNARLSELEEDEPEMMPQGKRPHQEAALSQKDLSKLPLADRLKAQFGDPTAPPDVQPEEKAPKPFKAIVAALEGGDEALAYKYAKQWARYQRNMRERTSQVVALSNQALSQEGIMLPLPSDDAEATFAIRAAEKAALSENPIEPREMEINQEAKKILNYALTEEEAGFHIKDDEEGRARLAQATPAPAQIDEATYRKKIRESLAGKVPVDPEGKAALYVFFRLNDVKSAPVMAALRLFHEKIKADPNVIISAFTLDRSSGSDLQAYVDSAQISFPVRSGGELAEKLQLKDSPTLVAVSPSTGKAFVRPGGGDQFYMDELIQIITGRGKAK